MSDPAKAARRTMEPSARSPSVRNIRKKAVLPEGAKPDGKRSHPAWWAAFALSGDIGATR